MEGRNLFQIVKDFLLSNMNKQLLVFLFFVLLSAVFWFILTLNGAYEKELKIRPNRQRTQKRDVDLCPS